MESSFAYKTIWQLLTMAGNDVAKKIAHLGCLCGITAEYWDNFGGRHRTSEKTYRTLLRAMGVQCDDPEDLDQELAHRSLGRWSSLVEPVQLIKPAPGKSRAAMQYWSPTPEIPEAIDIYGEMSSETGERYHWERRLKPTESRKSHAVPGGFRFASTLPLPANLELGYYDLTLTVRSGGREETGKTRLIAAPSHTYSPEWFNIQQRDWGFNLPLYAIKSEKNWGIGDFADLMAIIRWAGSLGAAFVGVNPLHAASLHGSADFSPYSPSSRIFLNFLYLNFEMIPEMPDCREAQELIASSEFQSTIKGLHDASLVLHQEVRRVKCQVLELLYETFCRVHGPLDSPRTARGEEFARFVSAKGEALAKFSRFNALAEHFQESDWRRWPEPYQNFNNPAVAEFALRHKKLVGRFQYAQWLTDSQLAQACQAAQDQNLSLTLYEDLALGANPGGFDTWAHKDLFALAVNVGAPPDAFSPQGQNWGLPPLIPERLRNSGYQLFINTLQANLPYGGMLRMDHAMALFRLLWIPQGAEASQGAYIHYPERELLAILALESVRRRAVIIGEDLGTVPPRIRRDLTQLGVFSYRVFYFQRNEGRQFLSPEEYPTQAMAAVTTHDLPTLAGFWQAHDLAIRRRLNLYPDNQMEESDAANREEDRRLLVEALQGRGLLPQNITNNSLNGDACPPAVREGVLTYLAQSRAALMEVRLEEVFGTLEQQNLPGTRGEHPNWRQKLPMTLEQMMADPEPERIAARINEARGKNRQ